MRLGSEPAQTHTQDVQSVMMLYVWAPIFQEVTCDVSCISVCVQVVLMIDT